MHDTLRDCTMNSVDQRQWCEFIDDIVMLWLLCKEQLLLFL